MHPTRNGNLTAWGIRPFSAKKIWWNDVDDDALQEVVTNIEQWLPNAAA